MFNTRETSNQNLETDANAKEQGENQTELNEAQFAEHLAEAEVAMANDGDAGSHWENRYHQLNDQFTRLAADFDNYRKRTREEQESLVKYGAQKSIMSLLPVLDNLDRATASLNESSDPKVLYKSFEMMQKQLLDGLNEMGLTKIQAIGQTFDPQLHEAVSQMPSDTFAEDSVMYEAQSGYQLHDKVIRPAKVVVSTGGAEGSSDSPQPSPVGGSGEEKKSNPFAR